MPSAWKSNRMMIRRSSILAAAYTQMLFIITVLLASGAALLYSWRRPSLGAQEVEARVHRQRLPRLRLRFDSSISPALTPPSSNIQRLSRA
jgi:hypothetical protein